MTEERPHTPENEEPALSEGEPGNAASANAASRERHGNRDADKIAREARRAGRRLERAAARAERRAQREAGKTDRESERSSRRVVPDVAGDLKRAAKEQARRIQRESKDAARAAKRALKDCARDATGAKPRRTQEERRETMRARLLTATVDCLVKYGYSGASTPKICHQARVSRGAQLHHFPTKESLIVASIEHLVTLRREEFRQAMAELPERVERGPVAIDLLWKMISGDTFYAWLELSVAARTDAKLAAAVHELNKRCQDGIRATFLEFFPDALGNPRFEIAPDFVFAVLEGLALRKLYSPDDERTGQVLFAIKALAGVVTPSVSLSPPSPPSQPSEPPDPIRVPEASS